MPPTVETPGSRNPAGGGDADPMLSVAGHASSAAEVAGQWGADIGSGLKAAEVGSRLARYGENRLAEKPPRSKWLALLDQFKSLLILVLIIDPPSITQGQQFSVGLIFWCCAAGERAPHAPY